MFDDGDGARRCVAVNLVGRVGVVMDYGHQARHFRRRGLSALRGGLIRSAALLVYAQDSSDLVAGDETDGDGFDLRAQKA